MAETTKASTGAKSEFWFNDGTALYKARQVKSFSPTKPKIDQHESTSLESDAKEYVPGDVDYGEFEVKFNYRPLSDTDTKLEAWTGAQTERAFRVNEAVRGVLTKTRDGMATVVDYGPDEVTRGGVMSATLRLRSTGAVTSSTYVAP